MSAMLQTVQNVLRSVLVFDTIKAMKIMPKPDLISNHQSKRIDLQVLVNLLSLSVFFEKSSEDSLSAHPQNLKLSQQNMQINVKLTTQSTAVFTHLNF